MNSLISTLKVALKFSLSKPNILIAFALVFVVPVLFLYSGQSFLDAGRANQDKLQRDRVAMLHDSISILLKSRTPAEQLKTILGELKSQNSDISNLSVFAYQEGEFSLIASSEADKSTDVQPDEDLANFVSIQPNETLVFADTNNGFRRWTAVRLVTTSDSNMFVYSEHNLSGADAYMNTAERRAYEGLVFVLVLMLILAWWQVRQINYRLNLEKLTQKLESRDTFTNMLVHELRTPLTAIRGYASLIREDGVVDDSSKSHAGIIEESSKRLLLLINDLLDVARIQSGKLKVASEEVNISKLVTAVVSELQPLAKEHSLSLVERSESNFSVLGDNIRLRQILINLISNALKYTKEGGVTIVTSLNAAFVEVRIADTGMGIKAEDQQKLFAPFFRVSGDETSSITGTGLGMWITKELISQMGATIAVESIKGVGTHVVINLPVIK